VASTREVPLWGDLRGLTEIWICEGKEINKSKELDLSREKGMLGT